MTAISFDIAAMHVGKSISQSTTKRANIELLSYVMGYYSNNLKVLILVTARSAVYLCHLI